MSHRPVRWFRAVAVLAVLTTTTGCGGDDSGGGPDPEATIVTVVDLQLDLPVEVPGDAPAPSNGVYAGEPTGTDPWESIWIGSDFDPEALRAAVRAFGESTGARYDDLLEQIVYNTTIGGEDRAVYVWVRTTDQGDHPTLLEIGTAAPTG